MEPELEENASYESWVDEVGGDVGQRDRLMRFVWWLIGIQFFAGPFAIVRRLLPPTIGIGQYSLAVDFRYLAAALSGMCLALLVLIPVIFAWSNRSVYWRITACVPVMFLLCIHCIVCLLFLATPSPGLLHDMMPVVGLMFLLALGISLFPLMLRAYQGNQLTQFVPHRFGSCVRTDWMVVAGVAAVIFLASPLIDHRVSTGLGVLAGACGMAVGVLVAIFVILIFREQSKRALWFAISSYVVLLFVIPCVGVWLADYVYFPLLPAGAGVWFVGVFSGAFVLLLHALLFRRMGYRMKKYSRKPVSPRVPKPVVDPFSD